MRDALTALSAAVTPKKALATAFAAASLGIAAAPAIATVTASAAPASLAMTYDGPAPHMTYD